MVMHDMDTDSHNEHSLSDGVGLLRLTVNYIKHVCCGVIGKSNGGRFCCRYSCNVASHKLRKVALSKDEARFLYSWTTRRTSMDQSLYSD